MIPVVVAQNEIVTQRRFNSPQRPGKPCQATFLVDQITREHRDVEIERQGMVHHCFVKRQVRCACEVQVRQVQQSQSVPLPWQARQSELTLGELHVKAFIERYPQQTAISSAARQRLAGDGRDIDGRRTERRLMFRYAIQPVTQD